MFDETLDIYSHKRVHIDIDPDSKPVHSMPYPVPQIYLKIFKKKLTHLVGLGVLAQQQESEWVVAEIGPDSFCSIPDLVQIWSRFGPDLVQIEVHPGPDQKIWTACPDMLSRFWTGPDHSGLIQSAFSCICRCT
jgi:hypothetical protein